MWIKTHQLDTQFKLEGYGQPKEIASLDGGCINYLQGGAPPVMWMLVIIPMNTITIDVSPDHQP